MLHIDTEYILVVDTNTYSYPFFKKLCAYCTGHTDENHDSQDLADMFFLEMGLVGEDNKNEEVIEFKNPFYGLVNYKQDQENVRNILSPCSIWLNKNYGCDAKGEHQVLSQDNWEDFNFPAVLSVGIYFLEEPEQNLIDLIKARSFAFFEKVWPYLTNEPKYKNVDVEGFRLISHLRYGKEKDI